MQRSLLALFCLLAAASAVTEIYSPPVQSHMIHLSGAPIDTRADPGLLDVSTMVSSEGQDDRAVFLVQLNTHCPMRIAKLEETFSIKFFGYIPENTMMVYCSPATAMELKTAENVTYVGTLTPAHKKSHSLKSVGRTVVESASPLSWLEGSSKVKEEDATVMLSVAMAHGADVEAAAARVAKAAGVLSAHQAGSQLMSVVLDASAFTDTVELVAGLPMVVLVERRYISHVHNRYAHGLLQTGNAASTPLAEAGLDGTGEIVAVGDTGVDYNRCAFADDKVKVNIITDPDAKLVDNKHRKIKGYWALQDALDQYGGHGTHVSGSTLGGVLASVSPQLAKYNGGAPAARLLMTDVGCISEKGCKCDSKKYCPGACVANGGMCPPNPRATFLPEDLNEAYFPWSYNNGARIHTNSWGDGGEKAGFGGTYELQSSQIDQFVYDHPDHLILFAAGNEGAYGFFSIGSQGMAKNLITVGASQTTTEGFVDSTHFGDYSGIVGQLNDLAKDTGDSLAGPEDCCDPDIATKHNGICTLIAAKFPDCTKIAELCCPKVAAKAKQAKIAANPAFFNDQNLATFTSVGTGRDGRIKPDVVSPGESTISVRSQETLKAKKCGDPETSDPDSALMEMSGTSMATPNLAGQAALVRQYYRTGFYPTGAPTKANGFLPSAALMKATIINSGRAVTGAIEMVKTWQMLDKAQGLIPQNGVAMTIPSAMQGFGRPSLASTLALATKTGTTTGLVLATDAGAGYADPKIDEGDNFRRCFVVADKPTNELKITLVWTDPPATPVSGKYLVNDLDLTVARTEDGTAWAGNHQTFFQADSGEHAVTYDRVNNVEQVTVGKPKSGVYMAHVNGFRVPKGPQAFAIVISGDVTAVECKKEYSLETASDNTLRLSTDARTTGALDGMAYTLAIMAGLVMAGTALVLGFVYVKRSREPTAYSRAGSLIA